MKQVTPLIYRPKQAAELLGVSTVTIWRRVKDGTLTQVRLGPRSVGITAASIDRLIAGAAS